MTPTPSHPSSPNSSRYVSLTGTQLNSPTSTFRSFPSTPYIPGASPPASRSGSLDFGSRSLTEESREESACREKAQQKSGSSISPLAHAAEHIAGAGSIAMNSIAGGLHDIGARRKYKADLSRRTSQRGENDVKGDTAEQGQVGKELREDLEGLSLDDRDGAQTPPLSTGDEVIQAARERNQDVRDILDKSSGKQEGTADPTLGLATQSSPKSGDMQVDADKMLKSKDGEIAAAPENTGALMLDMSGYKLAKDEEKDEGASANVGTEEEDSTDLVLGLDDSASAPLSSRSSSLTLHSQRPRRKLSPSLKLCFNRPTQPLSAPSSTTRTCPTAKKFLALPLPSLLSTSTLLRPLRLSTPPPPNARFAPVPVSALEHPPLLLTPPPSRACKTFTPKPTCRRNPTTVFTTARRVSLRSRPADRHTSSS